MPFDGAPSFEHKALVHTLPQEQIPLAAAQLDKRQVLEALKQAEQAREQFYESAVTGGRLNEDQKNLLKRVQLQGGAEELAHVVYTDAQTGTTYTGFDYFSDAPDVLDALHATEARYQNAKARHNEAAQNALQRLQTSTELPVNTDRVTFAHMPDLPGTELGADGRLRQIERGITGAWDEHQEQVGAHFHRVQDLLQVPFVMPSIDSILSRAQAGREVSASQEPVKVEAPMDTTSSAFAMDTVPDTIVPPEPVRVPEDYGPIVSSEMRVMPQVAPAPAPKKSLWSRLFG